MLRPTSDSTETYATSVTFFDLPNELILLICDHMAERDIYTLSYLCRRLHYLVLPAYLARVGITEKELSASHLKITHPHLTVLPDILRSLFIDLTLVRDIEIHCSETVIQAADRFGALVHGLERIASRTQSLKSVTLSFGTGRNLIHYDTHAGNKTPVTLSEWHAFARLTHALSQKQCEGLEIRDVCRFLGNLKHDRKPFKSSAIRNTFRRLLCFLHSLSPSLNPRRKLEPSKELRNKPDSWKPAFPLTTLKSFTPSASILFHYPIINWTIDTINQSPIEILRFPSDIWNREHWSEFLPTISIPKLRALHIKSHSLRLSDLSEFLRRHWNLTDLDLDISAELGTLPFLPLPASALCRLVYLTSNPDCIAHLFQDRDAFPFLRRVSVYSGFTHGQQSFDTTINTFVGRTRSLSLYLHRGSYSAFWRDFWDWLRSSSNRAESERNETSLQCVSGLVLYARSYNAISRAERRLLVEWLALFPALRSFGAFFDASHRPRMDLDAKVDFVRLVKESCPGMESISLEGEKKRVGEWLTLSGEGAMV